MTMIFLALLVAVTALIIAWSCAVAVTRLKLENKTSQQLESLIEFERSISELEAKLKAAPFQGHEQADGSVKWTGQL